MKKKYRRFAGAMAGAVLTALLSGMYMMGCGMEESRGNEIILADTQEAEPVSEGQSETGPEEAMLYVHVCGEVHEPGVYALPGGSRVMDAVESAGGMTEDADRDRLNLAETIADGQQIRIPGLGEDPGASASAEPRDDRVNINTASREELMTLPGIGASRAEDILSYRAGARFEKPEDIMKVPGIKEGAFRKLEGRIRTD